MKNILIVDDDEKIRRSLKRYLQRHEYNYAEAVNGQHAFKIMDDFIPDLILLDVMMPVMNGYEFCHALKNNIKYRNIFVIMLSAKARKEDKTHGLEFGADDYISKPFNPNELLERVKTGIEIAVAKRVANTDLLTGLFNRYYLNSTIYLEIEKCQRKKNDLSITILDIDNFTQINNAFDSEHGDAVLREVANLLLQYSRKTDSCVRWKDDKFITLLPMTAKEAAFTYAEKMRTIIESHSFSKVDHITVSGGVASLEKLEDNLFDQLNTALREAKTTGPNKIVVFN